MKEKIYNNFKKIIIEIAKIKYPEMYIVKMKLGDGIIKLLVI